MMHGPNQSRMQAFDGGAVSFALKCAASIAILFAARAGFCDTVEVARPADAAIQHAFAFGLGDFPSSKTPLQLEITRMGHHVALIGYDRSGATVARLTCLLCTGQEAAAAAAYFGDFLGRQYRGDPPGPISNEAGSTLSVNGAPVPALPANGLSPLFAAPVPKDTALRLRLAITAASLGASALVIGGIFIWLDGACSDQKCKFFHQLKGSGIGLVVSGALLETAAVLLWRLKRKKEVRP